MNATTSLGFLLERRAASVPERRAYTLLADGRDAARALTYRELYERAGRVAWRLREQIAAGDRVLLVDDNSLDFMVAFMGCMLAGVVAVPIPPLDVARLKRTLPRLRTVVADSDAAAVLTSAGIRDRVVDAFASEGDLRHLPWIVTDDPAATPQLGPQPVAPSDLAFLQYTSGSTSAPKGVMVTHANLLDNLARLQLAFGYDDASTTVTWMPYFHDYGLIDGLLEPLYAGASAYVVSPVAFVKRPWRWLEAVSQYRATHIHGPNFAFALCVDRGLARVAPTLDLSSLVVAGCAAEPIRRETAEQFIAAFARYGLRAEAFAPAYGLAEATLVVSAKRNGTLAQLAHLAPDALEDGRCVDVAPDHPRARTVFSCGVPAGDIVVRIVGPDGAELPDDTVGELWVASASVAAGYWKLPEATAETFGARTRVGTGPMLRTGDLAFTRAGEIYITGRIKDVLIVNGANHYPQDIELTVEAADPAIRATCVAAFPIDHPDGERLVVAAELGRRDVDSEAVIAAIRDAVAQQHELACEAIVLLPKGSLFKTSSGKVQRRACRAAFLDRTLEPLAMWRSPVSEDAAAPADGPETDGAATWEERLRRLLASRKRIPAAHVDAGLPFSSFGLSSLEAVEIAAQVEEYSGRSIPATALWEYPSVRAFAAYLAHDGASAVEAAPLTASDEPIAVIGIACDFPGGDSPAAFWRTVLDSEVAIVAPPAGRFPADAVALPAGYVGDLFRFDAAFFGISDAEATSLDPQQRRFLETAWHALEDAAMLPAALAGSDTGVFVGVSATDYAAQVYGAPGGPGRYAATGTSAAVIANRLSYFLDLHGPSLTIDTACSASLVALHQACNALAGGECELAIVGGVNAILSAETVTALADAQVLSPSGRCRPFDAEADGYVRGEGCGVVLLKRLSAARRDGNRVHAVVHGSAVVQDGRSNGLSAPNGVAQRRVIRRALARAGVAAERVEYVEAHGTGTPLGDPIELHALADCYGPAGTAACRVGAVKGAIGHLEGAAGIAGFIKTILALRHETIPPNRHLRTPNPRADLAGTRLDLPTEAVPWPALAQARFAAVSSFGFGGTLAHVILGDDPAGRPATVSPEPARQAGGENVLVLSALDRPALRELAARYARRCAAADDLGGLCASVGATRTAFAERASFRFDGRDDLIARLRAFAATGYGGSSDAPAATLAPLQPRKAWELPLYPFGGREYRVALAPPARRLPPQTFVTTWTRVAPAAPRVPNGAVRSCLLVGDGGSETALIAAAIDRRPELERVASFEPDRQGARPLVVVCGDVRDGEAPDVAARRRTEQLFAALRAPAARGAEVWAVTVGAVPAVAGDVMRLDGAGVWGAGRSAALELPERWGGLIDLAVDFTAADADRLLDAITTARGEDQLALRAGAWYAPRLAFAPQDATGAARFRDDAVYWVAGGAGALGRHAVRFLLEHGARRVVVTGRGAGPSEPFPGNVQYIQADVCSRVDCLRVLAEIDARGRPLAGVIHAAGIASECAIDALTPEAFHDVADAKIAGAWNLHAVTLDRPIELFVCFSSVAALWGGAGQAHYAAGNHFLDMLCEQRRRLGLPALALAWGPWSGGGMVSPDLAAQLAKIGLDLLDPAAAPAVLASALHGAYACIAAVDLRLDVFGAVYTARRPSPFLADILPTRAEPQLAAPRALERLAPEQIRALVGAIVGEQLGTGRRPDPERGLFDLGLDSLAVVAIRARLSAEFGVPLANADMFSYPTIAALAAHLVELARPASEPVVPAAAGVPDDDANAALSADEIARRIAVEFDALVQSAP